MASLLFAVAVAATALVAAGPAGAGATGAKGLVQLRAGDEVRVNGSRVGCIVEKVGIICLHQGNVTPLGKIMPQVGSYGGVLLVGGKTVTIFRNRANGKTVNVFERKPAGVASLSLTLAAGKASRVVRLSVGQAARLQGTTLDCAIVRSGVGAGKPTVYCSYDDAAGPVPGTNTILVSDGYAAAGTIMASRRTTVVYKHNQP